MKSVIRALRYLAPYWPWQLAALSSFRCNHRQKPQERVKGGMGERIAGRSPHMALSPGMNMPGITATPSRPVPPAQNFRQVTPRFPRSHKMAS